MGLGRRDVEHPRIDQAVMDDHVRGLQCFHSANGQQPGIARSGANKDDAATRVGIEKARHDREDGVPAPRHQPSDA